MIRPGVWRQLVLNLVLTGATSACTLGVMGPTVCVAQGKPVPTFNLFTPEADIAIGKASAVEAERQLPVYRDGDLEQYIGHVVARLAAVAPGARYPYRVRIIDIAEVNAFSMPGGPVYVTRGILQLTETEPEIAAVLAHEMAHIALRHGTNNASRLYLGKSGLGILGGLQGDRSHDPRQMINEVGGVGLNLAFVKFLNDDEFEADAAGARMLARAGYDPNVIPAFLGRVRTELRKDSVSYAHWLADHPSSKERDELLHNEMAALTFKAAPEIGGFAALRSKLPVGAKSTEARRPWPLERKDSTRAQAEPVTVTLPMPSARMLAFRQHTGFFTVDRPADWRVNDSVPGFGVVFAPVGGLTTLANGARTVVHGVIINHYAPFDGVTERAKRSATQHFAAMTVKNGHRAPLEDATDDLIRAIMWTSPHLSAPNASAERLTIDHAPAYSVLLTGLSPLTGEEERVLVYTRGLPDEHVVFMLCVAPARDFVLLEPTFSKMVQSLNVNEAIVHAATPSLLLPGRKPAPPE